jgi:tRNA pseudouridine38-40 synthase
VEGTLRDVFRTLVGFVPALSVAGRTDAGVHARRQVASLHLPSGTDTVSLKRGLDALTPPALSVLDLSVAAARFNARRDALARSYRYLLWLGEAHNPFLAPYAWHVRTPLDLGAMQAAAALVTGLHDFTAFTPTNTEHLHFRRRVDRCLWRRRGNMVWLEIEAESFLRHMVRSLVGTLVDVGAGKRTPEDMARLLEGAPRDAAGLTAPPYGLCLWDVRYSGSP